MTRSKKKNQVLLCTRPAKYPHKLNVGGRNLCCLQHKDQEIAELSFYDIKISFENNRVVYTQLVKTKVVEDQGDRCVVPIPPVENLFPGEIPEIILGFDSDFDVCFEDGKKEVVNYEQLSDLLGEKEGNIIKKLIINKPLKINETNKPILSDMFRFVRTIETKADVKCYGDMSELFFQSRLENFVGNTWNMKNVTSMRRMFNNADEFKGGISNWKTANVTDFFKMFKNASKFNSKLEWKTSKVTNMYAMFKGAKKFNGNVSKWDTSQVKNMSSMFYGAVSFNQDISKWKTSQVTDMSRMFKGAESFDQNISQWDTSRVTDMSGMFKGAVSFNQDISEWKTGNVEYMTGMFQDARKFNRDILTWDFKSTTGDYMALDGIFDGSAVSKDTRDEIVKRILGQLGLKQ